VALVKDARLSKEQIETRRWHDCGRKDIEEHEVNTKMHEDVDLDYYRKHKDNMLVPKQVAEKVVEMTFNDKKYNIGQSVGIG
jgi:hypothetical protein